MKKSIKLIVMTSFSIVLVFMFNSCETMMLPTRHIDISIDGYGMNQSLNNKSFIILPKDTNINIHSLQFRELSGYIEKILLNKGYIRANNSNSTDLVVFMDYGIMGPIVHTETKPLYRNETTTKRVPVNSKTKSGKDTLIWRAERETVQILEGFQEVEHVSFIGYCQLDCIDAELYRRHNEHVEMWTICIDTEGKVSDIRLIVPFLLAGAYEHIGNSTGRKLLKRVYNNNSIYRWLTEVPK